ncbi:MAG: hypothetical protein ABGY75_08760, partial [Gemmataceae bacterium]
MSRILLALLIATPAAIAAPVPKIALTAEQAAEFDRLWEASLHDTAAQVRLACRCLTQKEAAGLYLSNRLKPFTLTDADAKDLLAKLGSDDEKEWTTAYRTLRVYDIRLALTLPQAVELSNETAHSRLAGIVYHTAWGHSLEGAEQFDRCSYRLKPHEGGRQWVATRVKDGRETGGMGTFPDLSGWVESNSNAFDRQRVRFGMHLLVELGTPAALETLNRLTTGNPLAWPTKDATELVARWKRKKPADSRAVSRIRMVQAWEKPHQVTNVPAVVAPALVDPESVSWLRQRLQPLTLDEKRARQLLAAVLSDDEKVWRPALEELRRTDLRLAIPLLEAWGDAKTADQRVRMKWLLGGERSEFDPYRDYILKEYPPGEVTGWYLQPKLRDGIENEQLPQGFKLGHGLAVQLEVADMKWWWVREESAIHILDAIGTDEAFAIIKDMATGHPD